MSNCAAVSPISEHEEWCVPWDIWMVIRSGDLSAECVDHVRNRLDLKHARMDMTLLRPSAFFAHIYCLLASMLSSGETSRHPVDILHLRPLFSLLARSTRIVYIEGCTVSTSTDRS